MRLILPLFLLPLCTTVPPVRAAETDGSSLRCLYDMTPVSETNPVIVRVRECGIEIPLSEFQAYVKSTVPPKPGADSAKPGPLTLAQKRRYLNELIDDHFLLWDGYRQKADQTARLREILKNTETMLLQETLIKEEVIDKARTPEEYQSLSRQLLEKIFEKTDITISNEARDELNAAARRSLELTNAPPDSEEVMTPQNRKRPLAKSKTFTLTTGDVLERYLQIRPDRRPDLAKQDGLVAMLKALLGEQLLIDEARARGLEKSPHVLEMLQLNRNTLVRMYAVDQVMAQAVARMKAPDLDDRLRSWFNSNLKTRYMWKDNGGQEHIVSFERERESIQNDYFDALNERLRLERIVSLREERKAEIDERCLNESVVLPPERASINEGD
jgi:hypothetical protein